MATPQQRRLVLVGVMATIRTDELLTTAAFRGEVERVRAMLAHGASSTARSEQLCTALHWAVSMGHTEVAELLLGAGADTNARAADGSTPLHVAAREGDLAVAELLLAAGASPVICDSAGRDALTLALEFADEEVELAHTLRQARTAYNARLTDAAADAKARRKVEIVWEVDLLKAKGGADDGAAPSHGGGGMVDSGCGPDDALVDVGDGVGCAASEASVASAGTFSGDSAGTFSGDSAGTFSGDSAGTFSGDSAGTFSGDSALSAIGELTRALDRVGLAPGAAAPPAIEAAEGGASAFAASAAGPGTMVAAGSDEEEDGGADGDGGAFKPMPTGPTPLSEALDATALASLAEKLMAWK